MLSPVHAVQVAMLCFMMWMSGSTLHLFSIMTTLSGIYQPLSGAPIVSVVQLIVTVRPCVCACFARLGIRAAS